VIDRPIKVKVNRPYIAAEAARDKENQKILIGVLIGSGSVLGLMTATVAWIRARRKHKREQEGNDWETP